LTVIMRPSASVNAAMSSALPKACSEMRALESPFMPRHEYADICLISTTCWPNQRTAAGCTESLTKRSSIETNGQARVAAGDTASGRAVMVAPAGRPTGTCSTGPRIGGRCRA
jgi:hypothetical protein